MKSGGLFGFLKRKTATDSLPELGLWNPDYPRLDLKWQTFPEWNKSTISRGWYLSHGRLLLWDKRRGDPAERLLDRRDGKLETLPLDADTEILTNDRDQLWTLTPLRSGDLTLRQLDPATLTTLREITLERTSGKKAYLRFQTFEDAGTLFLLITATESGKGSDQGHWTRISLDTLEASRWRPLQLPFEDTDIVELIGDVLRCTDVLNVEPPLIDIDLATGAQTPQPTPPPLPMPMPISAPPNGYELSLHSIAADDAHPLRLHVECAYPSQEFSDRPGNAELPHWTGEVILVTAGGANQRVLRGDYAATVRWHARTSSLAADAGTSIIAWDGDQLLVVQHLDDPPGFTDNVAILRFGWLAPSDAEIRWWGWTPAPHSCPRFDNKEAPEVTRDGPRIFVGLESAYVEVPVPAP